MLKSGLFKLKTIHNRVVLGSYHSGTVTTQKFMDSLKKLESSNTIESNSALELIQQCDLKLIEMFPKERQKWLNYIFTELFPKKNVHYNQDHFSSYLTNTKLNKSSFDPFQIAFQMKERNISNKHTLVIDAAFIKQLCEDRDIKTALVRFQF